MPGPQPCYYHPLIFCPVGRGLDPSASFWSTPANGSPVGEGFIPPAHLPSPPTSAAACGQAALRAPFMVRSVGRSLAPLRGVGDAAPYSVVIRKAFHCRQPPRRPGVRPPYIPLLFTHHTKQKAGANISFAPAVLLLRSHSLITLFRYFSDCFRIVMGIILSFCEF